MVQLNESNGFRRFPVEQYLQEYYGEVDQENLQLTQFDVEALRTARIPLDAKALDFGYGGVLQSALAITPYVDEIFIADYPDQNIQTGIGWVNAVSLNGVDHVSGAIENIDQAGNIRYHDWNKFTETILQLEGQNPDPMAVLRRELELRRKIAGYFQCNAYLMEPLGHEYRNSQFDLLVINFVHESMIRKHDPQTRQLLSHSERMVLWEKTLKNSLKLLKNGGLLLLKALSDAEADYPVGDLEFPTLSINQGDIKRVMNTVGFRDDELHFQYISADPQIPRGYPGMICLSAQSQ